MLVSFELSALLLLVCCGFEVLLAGEIPWNTVMLAFVSVVCVAVRGLFPPQRSTQLVALPRTIAKGAAPGEGAFHLQWTGQEVPLMCIDGGEAMTEFERRVQDVYQVNNSVVCGEPRGQPVKGWRPGQFSLALEALRQQVRERELTTRGLGEPLDDVVLAHWLMATNLDVAKSIAGVQAVAERRLRDVGFVSPAIEWVRSGVALVPFEDRFGRPVLIVRLRFHVPGNIEVFARGLRATVDAMILHMLSKRQSGSAVDGLNIVEEYVMIFDFAGAGWSNFDRAALTKTFEIGSKECPNRLGQTLALNVDGLATQAANCALRLMHPRTRRKTLIVAPEDVHACMQQLVNPDLLPPEYGGSSMPWPEPSQASTFQEQVGEIAASSYLAAGACPNGACPTTGAYESDSDSVSTASSPRGTPRRASCFGCYAGMFDVRLTARKVSFAIF